MTAVVALQAGEVESDDLTAETVAAFAAVNSSRLIPRSRFELVNDIEFIVTDLSSNLLRLAAGHVVWIDQDAARFGWFVDPTPDTDEEFGEGGAAAERMGLLTVLAYKLVHRLGFEHDTELGHLMSETLAPGIRLLPIGTGADIDHAFAKPDWP